MFLKPQKLGNDGLSEEELLADRKNCKKIGPCGVGKKALYLNSFYIDRQYYIPVRSVSRVFKRVAMSKGGFSGKGMFATIPYLVVVYEDGKEKQCNFKYERSGGHISFMDPAGFSPDQNSQSCSGSPHGRRRETKEAEKNSTTK